ncbi:MAG TPA: IPT/TIG domain-containing protein [Thermoanaerobaculia bacterium]|nr:IPT/TIG domain-containing protein [Thermoanaerobaculia bacterium]
MKRRLLALLLLVLAVVSADAATTKKKKKTHKSPKTIAAAPAVDAEAASGLMAAPPTGKESKQATGGGGDAVARPTPVSAGRPVQLQLKRASSRRFDLRSLPRTKPIERERNEPEPPDITPVMIQNDAAKAMSANPPFLPRPNAPAPPPTAVYEGLDRFNWGSGSPPDTNGDAGTTYYIQTVNSSIGVYRKSDGFQEAAFTFNTFMSQGAFGNLCDTNNFGDPVVLYDTFEDRWIITDFAFILDGSGNSTAPAFQCFAASMTGNPLTGGWNFYSIQSTDFLNDYPKFGIWSDGLYMSANMFTFGPAVFQTARAWAFNKAQMYAGSPTVNVLRFDVPGGDFTAVPSNARLQTGTPPPGRPNLFVSTQFFLNALAVYKFHVDWNNLGSSTFTGPDTPLSPTSWPAANVANVPQSGTTQLLDTLQLRSMVQNQYTNFGGVESLWIPHTVRRGNTSGFAAPRWYQADVTGGTVAANLVQSTTWDPDGANVMHRWMPSLALDRTGNLLMGYSTSSSSTFPSIKYAGRLVGDPINTFSQTEQLFFAGTASQLSSTRWGDYASMTLDPDGCRFWFTTEYATGLDTPPVPPATVSPGFNKRWQTKFGSVPGLAGCTPVGAGGTVSGTVTVNPGGAPLAGATVNLGARVATTDGSGNYSFTGIPAGTYPSETASKPGFVTGSASSIVVTDGGTTTQNFSLSAAPTSACLTDTTQTDFLAGGVPSSALDLNTSPGDVMLSNVPTIDQQNTAGTSTGTGFGTPNWTGQTFIPAVTGLLVKVDVQLFCGNGANPCTGPAGNLTLSVRNTSGGLPTGADLASGTIPGFTSNAGGTFTVTFGAPPTLTAGTQYALVLRPVSNPAAGNYFWIRSSPSTYANGQRVLSADSGASWSADSTRDYNFKNYMQVGYPPSGTLTSGLKDSNPAGGITPIWSTLSWNATTPANTSIKFQVAASNNSGGPFNFVGPDGTAGTFFTTSPVQLQPQFYNFRYLEYKAILATTNNAATPVLSDVTLCFNDVDCNGAPPITPTPAQVCANSTGNSASGPAGALSYSWSITNGLITAGDTTQTITYNAGASGTVGLILNVILPNGCHQTNSINVPINPIPSAPTIDGADGAYCSGALLTSSAASGNQWYKDATLLPGETGQTYAVTATGAYTVTTTVNNCTSAQSAPRNVTQINTIPATPSISGTTNGTGTQDQACPEVPLTLNANGSPTATSYQWYKDIDLLPGETNSTYQATGAATYYVTATNSCGTTVKSAGYVVQNPTPHSPFISFRGQSSSVTTLAICQGSSQIIDSDSATGIQWWKDGAPIPGANSQSYTATQAGVYTAQLNALGCHSQFGRNVTITVDAMPPTPSITGDTNGTGTQDQACPEQPLTLHANGATGATSYTWYSDNAVIPNENSSTLVMTGVGNISVTATNGTCTTPHSATYVVQNPTPHAPFVTIRGQASTTTSLAVCAGTSVILDSDSATGIQWWKDGAPIPGAGSQSYTVTASGVYTAQLNALGCHSQFGRNITITINPNPPTPTITPSGPTTFCQGGSVTLQSSSATGNQWKLNGSPIGGATATTYLANASGSYTVTVTDGNGCSATSAATVVTVNPNPNATITAPTTVVAGSTGNAASVANAGGGATYNWSITNGTITGGTGTNAITFTAGSAGPLTLNVTVTTAAGCSDAKSKNVTVISAVTVTSIVPANGSSFGGQPVTINGTGFVSGATVTIGGNAATNVVFVNSTKLTAKTPAHAAGTVNVTVTNPDTGNGTLTNGYTYHGQHFDPNNDGAVDPADVFFLVNYLFLNGPAPMGPGGMPSGDANGDSVVDPADIFFTVAFVFDGGPMPNSAPGPRLTPSSTEPRLAGGLSFGEPVRRGNRFVVPVILSIPSGVPVPRGVSMKVRGGMSVARAGAAKDFQPVFETSGRSADGAAYIAAYGRDLLFTEGDGVRTAVVAEVEAIGGAKLEFDPALTMLSDAGGARIATAANGQLHLTGTRINVDKRGIE